MGVYGGWFGWVGKHNGLEGVVQDGTCRSVTFPLGWKLAWVWAEVLVG